MLIKNVCCYWCGKESKICTLSKNAVMWYDVLCNNKLCRNKKFFTGSDLKAVIELWNEFNDIRRK